MSENPRIAIERSPLACPVCKQPIRPEREGWVACGACFERHHERCWRAAGKCASCGAGRVLAEASDVSIDGRRAGTRKLPRVAWPTVSRSLRARVVSGAAWGTFFLTLLFAGTRPHPDLCEGFTSAVILALLARWLASALYDGVGPNLRPLLERFRRAQGPDRARLGTLRAQADEAAAKGDTARALELEKEILALDPEDRAARIRTRTLGEALGKNK